LVDPLTRLNCRVEEILPVSCLGPEIEDEMAKSGMSLRHGTIEMKKLGVHRRDAVDEKKLKCSGVRMF
jgi:hypothetical protein